MIIDTGLSDTQLTALAILADAEMLARGVTATYWTTSLLKQCSMLITASLAALNDTTSYGKSDYAGFTGQRLSETYRQIAENLMAHQNIALYIYNETLPNE